MRRFWNWVDDWLMKPDPDDYVVNRYVRGYSTDKADEEKPTDNSAHHGAHGLAADAAQRKQES